MALLLSIETSAATCSVALHNGRELSHSLEVKEPQAHAAQLGLLVEQLCSEAAINLKQLAAVAISSGPGSYTGLRIGTSLAKGLCMGLEIPLIAVSTLEAMAHHVAATVEGKLLCPMIDARRMEVYAQVFDGSLNSVTDVQAVVVDKDSFAELLAHRPVLFFGDGAQKCKEVLRHSNAEFLDGIYPKAEFIGVHGQEKFEQKQFADLIAFTPFYFKEFVAKKAQSFF
jgi:tRNA threonylcarbamoyladenosine biosynthesis protein TsaB